MLNAAELLAQVLRSGLSRSTATRLRHAMGLGQPGAPSGAPFVGLAEPAADFLGADQPGASPRAPGAPEPRAAVPIGDGSGAVALLSGLARSALGRSPRPSRPEQLASEAAAPGAGGPQEAAAAEQAERSATLILAAMINAAKADGQIDQEELQRIVGRLRAAGARADALDFVMGELRKPMDLDGLIRKVPSEQVAVQLYAASLLAIEMDTEAERRYLRRLAHGLRLEAGVVQRVHQCLGMDHV